MTPQRSDSRLWAATAALLLMLPLPLAAQQVIRPDPGGINIRDAGAVPGQDSYEAITAAISQASTIRRQIYVPSGPSCYLTSRPILLHQPLQPSVQGEVQGYGDANENAPCISASGYFGPVFHARGTTVLSPVTTTSLVSGPGVAFKLESDWAAKPWFDLSDVGPSAVFEGLAALSIEGFIYIEEWNTDFVASILRSFGSITGDNPTETLRLDVDLNGRLHGCVNVGGTCSEIVSSGSLSPRTLYHFAMVFNGSSVSLFYGIPGKATTLAGSVSASGLVRGSRFEQFTLGGTRGTWPHGPIIHNAPRMTIDSLRFSNSARHTSNYTAPNAKFSTDADTLFLLNFDDMDDDFMRVQTSNGVAWVPWRGNSGVQSAGLKIGHLTIASQGTGIFLSGIILAQFHDLSIFAGEYGIDSNNDTFLDRFERLSLTSNGSPAARAGLATMSQSGISTYANLDVTGWPVGFASRTGGGTISDSYFHGGAAVTHIVLHEGGWNINAVSFSAEDANPALFTSDLLLNGVTGTVIQGGGFERYVNGTGPAIQVRGGVNITIVGADFFMHPASPQVVEILSPPAQPVTILNARKTQSAVPWSLSGWVDVWPSMLKGAPTISSGFGTSASVVSGSTGASMRINVGAGGAASSGVIAMPGPPALNGWNCAVNNLTAAAAHRADNTVQTASTTTTVTIGNQIKNTGAAVAWSPSDLVTLQCESY